MEVFAGASTTVLLQERGDKNISFPRVGYRTYYLSRLRSYACASDSVTGLVLEIIIELNNIKFLPIIINAVTILEIFVLLLMFKISLLAIELQILREY